MPILGLGTWKSAPGEVKKAVKEAIKIGYRHIDCASIYMNEREVGEAISESIKEGIVTRDELWITSKLWNNAHEKDRVIPALQKTLKDLQLDYLDLYLIHWPVAHKYETIMPRTKDDYFTESELSIPDTWEIMEEAVKIGLTRHIGVSNFGKKKLANLIANCTIIPEVNQVELNPYFQQDDLVEFCKLNDIHVTAYSPLGSNDRPKELKAENEPTLLEDKTLLKLADDKDISIAQLILSWIVSRDISVIPKSVNPARLKQNLTSADIKLFEADIKIIESINKNRRYVSGDFWDVENLWD